MLYFILDIWTILGVQVGSLEHLIVSLDRAKLGTGLHLFNSHLFKPDLFNSGDLRNIFQLSEYALRYRSNRRVRFVLEIRLQDAANAI